MTKDCNALTKKNRKTHLSGDCEDYYICGITGKGCIGREIRDDDDESSQFFSRAKASFNPEEALNCPVYGLDTDGIKTVLKLRKEAELKSVLNEIDTINNS